MMAFTGVAPGTGGTIGSSLFHSVCALLLMTNAASRQVERMGIFIVISLPCFAPQGIPQSAIACLAKRG